MKNNIYIFLFLLAGIMLIFSACQSNAPTSEDFNPNPPTASDLIFYYSNTCPHCQVVEQYMIANDISTKVPFISKEVGENQANADDLLEKASKCGINQNDIGVPFLWDGSKCYLGQDEIINFFKAKTNAL